MDADHSLNVQSAFFNQIRKDRSRISVLLTNGQRVSGHIKSFDKFTLLLEAKGGEQIIFKHAIASVSMFRASGGQPKSDHRPAVALGESPEAQRNDKEFGNFIDFGDKKA